MHPIAKGSLRSKTNWLGLAVLVLGYLQTNMAAIKTLLGSVVREEMIEATMGLVGIALGVAIIVVRFFTTESLAEKGGTRE